MAKESTDESPYWIDYQATDRSTKHSTCKLCLLTRSSASRGDPRREWIIGITRHHSTSHARMDKAPIMITIGGGVKHPTDSLLAHRFPPRPIHSNQEINSPTLRL